MIPKLWKMFQKNMLIISIVKLKKFIHVYISKKKIKIPFVNRCQKMLIGPLGINLD